MNSCEQDWKLVVEHPNSAMIRIEVLESSRWTFYWRKFDRPMLPTSSDSSASTLKPGEDEANDSTFSRAAQNEDVVIGFGWLSLSEMLSGTRRNVWVDLRSGGGCINLQLQVENLIEVQLK